MARSIPTIRDDSLQVPTLEGDGTTVIALGSAAWDSWVEDARSFRFESAHASFTARKEQRPGGWYWYAYRRHHGTLHIAYLGKSDELSIARLHTVATVLECAEDSSAETSQQARQRSLDASLHEHHPSSIPSPLALSGEGSHPSATPVSHHNLPIQLTSLVGREATIATATALLRRPEVRLLSLIGTGGIGKTRLAIAVATQLLDDFSDGVCFVALAPLRDPDMVLPTIAHTLGLKESGSEPLMDRLHEYLRHKHLLLVMDNFEHLMPAAPVVGELLTTCPILTLLVTSREVLHLSAEQQFSVPPLAVPDRKQVPQVQSLREYPALELFLQRARAVKHDFQVHENNAQALADICTRLDGLPLAIELAAARITFLSPQALLARLDHRLQVLTHGPTDLPERQQTLRNTIAWSYELLKPEEQRLFRRLSVFVGGCSFEALEAVYHELGDGDAAAHLFERVTSLIDKSLLHTTDQEGEVPRLTMLETIREYGLECLEASREMEVTRQAHAMYYLRFSEEVEPELDGPRQAIWLDQLKWEHDNLRAALQWSLEQREAGQSCEMALRLGGALLQYWAMHGHYYEGRSFLEQALAGSQGVAKAMRAKALIAAAQLALDQGDHEQAKVLAGESLALYRRLTDTRGITYSLNLLGVIAWKKGNLAALRALNEEALALSQGAGDKDSSAWSLYSLAVADCIQGEYAAANAGLEESLALFRELGNTRGIADVLLQLAWVLYLSQSDPAMIHPLLEEGLLLSREADHKGGIASFLNLSGKLALEEGDTARVRTLAEESLARYKGLGNGSGIADSLVLLAKVEVHQGNHTAAHALYEESLAISRKVNPKELISSDLEGLAGVAALQGEPAWAAQLWGAAEALRGTIGAPLPPVYRPAYEHAVTAARAQCGEKPFAAAWVQGRTMTLEQVLSAQEPVSIAAPIPADRVMAPPVPKASTFGLTAREIEVLGLVAQGLTDEQVAQHLVISRHTVNSHLKAIYGKLGISSRNAATHYALQHHLL